MKIIELRHVEPEGPAAYLPVLERFGEVSTVRLWSDPLPVGDDWDVAIVMGGPMGANDGGSVPWIDEEIAFLRNLVERGVPVWGVCLGSQLLAAALGTRVWTGEKPEVGVLPIGLTAQGRRDPVWGGLPDSFSVLQWHGDSFDLPEGAELLASSEAYAHQLYRVGRSYGIQFHLEADAALSREWLSIPEYRTSLEQSLGGGSADGFLAEVEAVSDRTRAWAAEVMERWLVSVVRAEPRERIS